MSLTVKDLDYQIGNDKILEKVSLEIQEGEFPRSMEPENICLGFRTDILLRVF